MAKRCGYCRLYGHDVRGCETKAGILKTAAVHVGNQRQELAQLLIRNGFGVGALVNAYAYEAGEEVPCLITQESLDSVLRNNFVEFHNVRYSKRASTRMYDFVGRVMHSDEEHTFTVQRPSLHIALTPMQTGIRQVYGNIHVSMLANGLKWKDYPAVTNYSWDHPCKLLAGSDEGSVSEKAMLQKFHIHDRLGGGFIDPIFS